MMRLLSSDHL